MTKIKAWEFDDRSLGGEPMFDGRSRYAEVHVTPGRVLSEGTLELRLRPATLERATVLARGVPGRDPGAFTLTVTHAGTIILTCTDRRGAPYRTRTAVGFFAAGERLQVTLSWGEGCTLSAVNLDRRMRMPDSPACGHVVSLPDGVDIRAGDGAVLTFGAAAGGAAPFFRGAIERVTLADCVEPPTVAPPTARILRLDPPAERPRRALTRPALVIPGPGAAPSLADRTAIDPVIETVDGDRRIGTLAVGDRIVTRDHGAVPVLAILRVELDLEQADGSERIGRAGVRLVPSHAYGTGYPSGDMILGPLQDVVETYGQLGLPMFPRIGSTPGRYHHLVFAQDEIVRANGLWVCMRRPDNLSRLRPGLGPRGSDQSSGREN